MKAGFVPALGTPLDENGYFLEQSYKKHIEDMLAAGAVGILCMGSMGQQAYIRQGECPKVAKCAVETVAGRVPVFVGAMDCSIFRAKERLEAMEDLAVDGFVFTTPYYAAMKRDQVMNYYKAVAKCTKHNILLYDLPSVTQTKITYDMVLELLRDVPNLIGIKSNDTQMFRKLKLNPDVPKDFIMVYSGMDTFDIAYKWGLDQWLDGMLSCTPYNTAELSKAFYAGDYEKAAKHLSNIIELRDFFLGHNLMAAFSTTMNMLGYEGNFAQDFVSPFKTEDIPLLREELIRIGEPV